MLEGLVRALVSGLKRQELKSRAEIISKKEEILKEKGELELKHLRASQQLARVSPDSLNLIIFSICVAMRSIHWSLV